MNKKYLILLVLLVVMMAAGCTESSSEKTNSQTIGDSPQNGENSSQGKEPLSTSTATSVNQDAEWISLMQTQSIMIQKDFIGIGSNQDPFDAEGLAKWGQIFADDTQKAIEENNNYTVSPALVKAKEHWEIALRNYNSVGQFTVIGANAYLNGDETSASTNFQKASMFIDTGNANVNLTTDYMKINK